MSILIKDMKMPTTGLYFVSVDNTGGRDKTVMTVERMLGNRDVRQIIGSFELVPVPPHGRLIDAEPIMKFITDGLNSGEFGYDQIKVLTEIQYAPTIIEAEGREE